MTCGNFGAVRLAAAHRAGRVLIFKKNGQYLVFPLQFSRGKRGSNIWNSPLSRYVGRTAVV